MMTRRRAHDPMMEAHFLNVDLVVLSRRDVAPLVAGLAPRAFDLGVQRRGRWYFVAFELSREAGAPDAAVRRLAAAVAALRGAAREVWNAATQRDFDVGV